MSASTAKKTAPVAAPALGPKILIGGEVVGAIDNMLPKSRIASHLESVMKRRSPKAAVATAALLSYIFAEVLEVAAKHADDEKHVTLTNRDIMMGVRGDVELDKLFRKCSFVHAGQVPFIHPKLLPKKSRSKKTAAALAASKAPLTPKSIKN